jgi:hypothetical protein
VTETFKWLVVQAGKVPAGFHSKALAEAYAERLRKDGRMAKVESARVEKAKRNPLAKGRQQFYIHAQKGGRGPIMLYNGRSFTNQPGDKPKPYDSATNAASAARHLLGRFSILKEYRIWVSDQFFGSKEGAGSRKVNPASREAIDAAAQKLVDFSGHEATHVERVPARSKETTGWVLGEIDLIGYTARRDGKTERYGHHFRKRSRPLLASSTDGKQLHIVGGRYEVTEAGVEDR